MTAAERHITECRRTLSTLRASAAQNTLDWESFDARVRVIENHLTELEAAIASGNPPPRTTVRHLGSINGGAS